MPDMAVTTGDFSMMCHSSLSNIISLFDMTVTTEGVIILQLWISAAILPPKGKWSGAEQDKCKN